MYYHYVLFNERHGIELYKTVLVCRVLVILRTNRALQIPLCLHDFIGRYILTGVNLLLCSLLNVVTKMIKENSSSKTILPHRVLGSDGMLQLCVQHGRNTSRVAADTCSMTKPAEELIVQFYYIFINYCEVLSSVLVTSTLAYITKVMEIFTFSNILLNIYTCI